MKTPRELRNEADAALVAAQRTTRELCDRLEATTREMEHLRVRLLSLGEHVAWQNGVISRMRFQRRALRGVITKLRKRIEIHE